MDDRIPLVRRSKIEEVEDRLVTALEIGGTEPQKAHTKSSPPHSSQMFSESVFVILLVTVYHLLQQTHEFHLGDNNLDSLDASPQIVHFPPNIKYIISIKTKSSFNMDAITHKSQLRRSLKILGREERQTQQNRQPEPESEKVEVRIQSEIN